MKRVVHPVWEFELVDPPDSFSETNLGNDFVIAGMASGPSTLKILHRGETAISMRGVADPETGCYLQMWGEHLHRFVQDLNRVSEVTTQWAVQDDLGNIIGAPFMIFNTKDRAEEYLQWVYENNEKIRVEAKKQKVSLDRGNIPDTNREYIAWFRSSTGREKDGGLRKRTYKIVRREVTSWVEE